MDAEPQIQPRIFIIESPGPVDALDGRNEGQALRAALELAEIPCQYFNVANLGVLATCFDRITQATRIERRFLAGQLVEHIVPAPYLHFSAHGDETGLGLTGGDLLEWSKLREYLVRFCQQTQRVSRDGKYGLVSLSLSCCRGIFARTMLVEPFPYPCMGLVAPDRDVTWSDSLTAFVTFFHHVITKDTDVGQAVRAMNAAAALDNVFRMAKAGEA